MPVSHLSTSENTSSQLYTLDTLSVILSIADNISKSPALLSMGSLTELKSQTLCRERAQYTLCPLNLLTMLELWLLYRL